MIYKRNIKFFCWLALIFMMIFMSACSGKTPIQKYKAAIDKQDVKVHLKAIETLKDGLAQETEAENFVAQKEKLLSDMDKENKSLKKSVKKIKVKASEISTLHNNMVQYIANNELLIANTEELLTLYQSLGNLKDEKQIEETYGKIVQIARSIDTLSQQTNAYKVAWEEGLITMDVKTVQ